MKVKINRSDKPGSVAHAGDMARRLAALAACDAAAHQRGA